MESSRNLGGGSRSLSLEGLLQQAWLQSQSRPKVARRSVSDSLGAGERRRPASSQSSFAELMARRDAGDQASAAPENLSYFHKTRSEPENLSYFHKTRSEPEVPEFLRRRAVPRLQSYSKKTQKPQRRRSGSGSDGVSQSSSVCNSLELSDLPNSSNSSCSFSNGSIVSHTSMDDLFDVVDSEAGLADLVVETEVLNCYFDEFLSNDMLGFDKCLMQLQTASYATRKKFDDDLLQSSAVDEAEASADPTERWNDLTIEDMQRSLENSSSYQAIAAEIAGLMSSEPNVVDGESSEIFAPSEELTVLKIMEGFTSMMSKHIQDVSACNSDTVDYRTWITEDSDNIDACFDDAWKTYFEKWHYSLPIMQSSLDSNVLQEGAEDSNLSQGCTNMTELLYRCALAVSRGDHHSATEGLEELRKNSSPYGNSMERLAHYVREALVARMSGTGEELYTVITNNHPSAETMLKAFRVFVDNCPYVKLKHFLSTTSILDAMGGANRVHVIHYGALFGTEWPSLLKHLSERPGGPPHFRLTAIDIPYPVGDDPLKKLKGLGWRIEKFAKQYRVPFEFQALAGNWESFTAKDMKISKDEVLVVSAHRTHLIHDEGVLGASPRELLLKRIRSLNPKVVVLYVESAACNSPFFMPRFRESVKHYSALYDSLEVAFAPDAPERTIIEREVLGRELLNIIACEGHARIERAEPYRQWQNRMDRAGFILRPLNPVVFSKIKAMMASFHQDFGVGEDDGWLLMGIKDQITCASGVWEPKAVMSFITT